MQENQLHFWRLKDKTDSFMTGYGAKVKSFAFVYDKIFSNIQMMQFVGRLMEMDQKVVNQFVFNAGNKLVTFVEPLNENAIFTGLSDGWFFYQKLKKTLNHHSLR